MALPGSRAEVVVNAAGRSRSAWSARDITTFSCNVCRTTTQIAAAPREGMASAPATPAAQLRDSAAPPARRPWGWAIPVVMAAALLGALVWILAAGPDEASGSTSQTAIPTQEMLTVTAWQTLETTLEFENVSDGHRVHVRVEAFDQTGASISNASLQPSETWNFSSAPDLIPLANITSWTSCEVTACDFALPAGHILYWSLGPPSRSGTLAYDPATTRSWHSFVWEWEDDGEHPEPWQFTSTLATAEPGGMPLWTPPPEPTYNLTLWLNVSTEEAPERMYQGADFDWRITNASGDVDGGGVSVMTPGNGTASEFQTFQIFEGEYEFVLLDFHDHTIVHDRRPLRTQECLGGTRIVIAIDMGGRPSIESFGCA